ncbi:MAG: ABC transporter permease, partial [Lachnospiraceae bacterium]|nr:ABC transporter permease [Lachnospiraceae bacterium]
MNIMKIAIPYGTIMLFYFILLSYGQTLAQSVVMEKESKLMDTMLVSVRPESLVFGKLLASIAAAVMQILIWLISLVAGFSLGALVQKMFFPGAKLYLTVFFAGMKDINVFRPINVFLAIVFLILGLVLYMCLAAIAGSMSSTKEDVGSKSSLFIFPLLISFFILIGAGGINTTTTKTWMLIFPFTSAMIMPANVSLGQVSPLIIISALLAFVALILLFVIGAGKIYKMMSLYKGNRISITEVLKRTFAGDKKA